MGYDEGAGLKNISDTAFLVATYRAMESERPDALFRDPYAKLLVGDQGPAIINSLKSGKKSSWFLVARTSILDEWIQNLIRTEGIDTILNLAAGLDTRAYRLELPKALRWFDVDLPEISEYKKTKLKGVTPQCQYENVPLDLTRQAERSALFDRVARDSRKTLILSEGFLMYLTPTQVKELALELAQYSPFRFWLAELIGPFQLKLIQWKWGKAFKAANAEMTFAPANGPDFFSPCGWNSRGFRSSFDEALKIHRAPRGAALLKAFFRALPFNAGARVNRAGITLLTR